MDVDFRKVQKRVRFLRDDRGALFKAGEIAEDLGPETPDSQIRLLRMVETGELISLTLPYERNLIEEMPPLTCGASLGDSAVACELPPGHEGDHRYSTATWNYDARK